MALSATPNGTYGIGYFESIATYNFTSTLNTYTFTSIPGTFTDLRLVVTAKGDVATNFPTIRVGNGSVDTGSNYDRQTISAQGNTSSGAISAWYDSNQSYASINYYDATSTDYKYMAVTDILQYSATDKWKTFLTQGGSTSSGLTIMMNTWRSTSAINTLEVFMNTNNFVSGSTLSLYGRKAA